MTISKLTPQEWPVLEALSKAAVAVVSGLSLPRTLQHITDITREMVGAKYTALGVPSAEGMLKAFITSGLQPTMAAGIAHEPKGLGLLGALLDSDDTIRLENLHTDPRSAGFCANHPEMNTFLGVPIIGTNHQRLGNLYLCDKLDGELFTEADEKIVQLLSSFAAIAIENAQLHSDLQKALINTERDRIAMELHDGVIQLLYAVGMKLEIIRGNTDFKSEESKRFQSVFDDLNTAIEDIRGYIHDLRSIAQEQTTLHQQLRNLAQHFKDFAGVDVAFNVPVDLPALSDLQRHSLLQIVREALANVARHAEAKNVDITIHSSAKKLHVAIQDDGKGFDSEQMVPADHYGLNNLHQRARSLNGTLTIESAIGMGTSIYLVFPLKRITV